MKQTTKHKANNCHIDPILYNFYLRLNEKAGAVIVHRRHRKSSTCIEIVFLCNAFKSISGRLNTLREAEACGYWIICRAQRKGKRQTYRGHLAFQLFLTPVHPKKRHASQVLAQQASLSRAQAFSTAFPAPESVTFEPIIQRPHRGQLTKKPQQNLHMSKKSSTFARFFALKVECEDST